jgi:hypothetical protein
MQSSPIPWRIFARSKKHDTVSSVTIMCNKNTQKPIEVKKFYDQKVNYLIILCRYGLNENFALIPNLKSEFIYLIKTRF